MATSIVTKKKTMTATIMMEQVVCLVMRAFWVLRITDVGSISRFVFCPIHKA
jgi:hypothetical protein